MPKTETINGVRFTDYTLAELRNEARYLANSKAFTDRKAAKLESFVLRVTDNGAQIIAKVSGANGEIERGMTL